MNINLLFKEIEQDVKKKLGLIKSLRSERIQKSDLSYVTEGDLLINQIIKDIISNQQIDVLLVSEEDEFPLINNSTKYIIVLDPIDGTENFTSGMPEWGISISCYFKEVHIASMLACPELDIWFKTGDTIQRNYSRIRGLSSSLSMEELIKATQGHEYRILGCCVYNMINVIKGSYLSFENPKGAHSWDILAGLNLALENNLNVTVNGKSYAGEYLQPDKKYRFKVENQ